MILRYCLYIIGPPNAGQRKQEFMKSLRVVMDEYQGLGIGKGLLRRLVVYARAKGIQSMRGNLEVGNDRMLLLIRRSGLPNQTRFVDGVWEVSIDLRITE